MSVCGGSGARDEQQIRAEEYVEEGSPAGSGNEWHCHYVGEGKYGSRYHCYEVPAQEHPSLH